MNSLSQAQKDCLRLAYRGKSSKEIARLTGFAPSTVDTYLSKAAITLGVGSRREAARNFMEWENGQVGKIGFLRFRQGEGIDKRAPSQNRSGPEAGTAGGSIGRMLSKIVFLPPIGGRENDLTVSERIQAIMKIGLVSAVTLIAIALVMRAGFQALQ